MIEEVFLTPSAIGKAVSPPTVTIKIQYQWRPKHCSICKVFGHNDINCPSAIRDNSSDLVKEIAYSDATRQGLKTSAAASVWRVVSRKGKTRVSFAQEEVPSQSAPELEKAGDPVGSEAVKTLLNKSSDHAMQEVHSSVLKGKEIQQGLITKDAVELLSGSSDQEKNLYLKANMFGILSSLDETHQEKGKVVENGLSVMSARDRCEPLLDHSGVTPLAPTVVGASSSGGGCLNTADSMQTEKIIQLSPVKQRLTRTGNSNKVSAPLTIHERHSTEETAAKNNSLLLSVEDFPPLTPSMGAILSSKPNTEDRNPKGLQEYCKQNTEDRNPNGLQQEVEASQGISLQGSPSPAGASKLAARIRSIDGNIQISRQRINTSQIAAPRNVSQSIISEPNAQLNGGGQVSSVSHTTGQDILNSETQKVQDENNLGLSKSGKVITGLSPIKGLM